jgi:predicted nucleotidyltransferase
MPNNVQKIIDNFLNQIKLTLGNRVKKIILYGSYARGDYNNHSDIDIMILTNLNNDELDEFRQKISDIAFDIELDTGIVISPLLKNIKNYNERIDVIPFYMNVNKEGIVLHG